MRCASLEELQRDPVGRFVQGETFLHFCAQPQLWGVMLWGRPTEEHARELGRSLVLELAPPAIPHVSFVDASRLEGGDTATFGLLERYMTLHGDALREWVQKLAIVRPRGFGGAIVTGAYEVVPRPYPVAIFDDPRQALDWLATAMPLSPPAETVCEVLKRLVEDATGAPPVVSMLRGLLDAHVGRLTLGEAAQLLKMSDRTLQRRLSDAGVTFQDEVAETRIRAAKRRLVETDDPITTIALDVGCASVQHLNALFRKRAGASPTAFRKGHSGGQR